jgi:hypothetical protein
MPESMDGIGAVLPTVCCPKLKRAEIRGRCKSLPRTVVKIDHNSGEAITLDGDRTTRIVCLSCAQAATSFSSQIHICPSALLNGVWKIRRSVSVADCGP